MNDHMTFLEEQGAWLGDKIRVDFINEEAKQQTQRLAEICKQLEGDGKDGIGIMYEHLNKEVN